MSNPQHNVLFIACGASKRHTPAGPVPVLDLYTGRQFALARRLEALGWSVVVISAGHGLVASPRKLSWYDQAMTGERSARCIARIQHDTLNSPAAWTFRAMTMGAHRAVFYGGEHYFRIFEALVTATRLRTHEDDFGSPGCEVVTIIGRGCGEHYSVLAEIVREEEAAAISAAA